MPEKVKGYLADDILSPGHAKLLINLENADHIAEVIISNGLNVREAENYIKSNSLEAKPQKYPHFRKEPGHTGGYKDDDTKALEQSLSEALGMIVKIDHFPDNGRLSILFHNFEQLDKLTQKLGGTI